MPLDINEILNEAASVRASDIHFTVGLPPIVRVNGDMKKFAKYPDMTEPLIVNIINQITNMKQKQIIQQGLDADFSYVSSSGQRNRVNVYRQKGYHSIAFRLLFSEIPTLKELGMPALLSEFAMQPRGLILVTGPTGSGKSTTLAAMIDYINRQRNCHIVTIEDPIEYVHNHKQSMITQREVNTDVESFSKALRSALREDPDVILLGEMRDFETISAAVTAAETGHLVLSTLHTTGAAETLDRIIGAYPADSQGQIRSQLSSVLIGIVSQILLPTADKKGRIAALELLKCTDPIAALIREGKIFQISNSVATGKAEGMFTLDQHLANLVRTGKITDNAAKTRCRDPKEFAQYLGMR